MECPLCNEELDYHDYYGKGWSGHVPFKKQGNIYRCLNEKCRSEQFNYIFHTDNKDELREGHPC